MFGKQENIVLTQLVFQQKLEGGEILQVTLEVELQRFGVVQQNYGRVITLE